MRGPAHTLHFLPWEDEITQLSNTFQQVDLATVFLFCNQSILLCNSDDSGRGGGGGGRRGPFR